MAGQKIPYPPSPDNVPDDLTHYPASYRSQQNLLLVGLFLFLLMYLGMIGLCALLGVWCFFTLKSLFLLKLIGLISCGICFLFLVKGFFKRRQFDKDMHLEITEEDQPVLFGFIRQLCDELGAPEPNKVFVSPDVNAAMMYRTNLLNLFVEPKKNLLIGLGLVNALNMSEFKAVMAHEFGHFLQSDKASCYTNVVRRIMFDLVEGEDWFDRMIDWCKRQQNAISVVGYVIGAPLWLGRKLLWWMLRAITLQDRAVSREAEFHADLVAVSAAGSNAIVHGFVRVRFGMLCFLQALRDMSTAADHKLYTRDLYLHQDRAAPIVRREKKDPKLGLPPELATPEAGKDVVVFDPEKEELEDEDETPPMWRSHPNDSDREVNAKEQFVPAVEDHRSPWILFTDAADLKERMTYKFYRQVFKIKKDTDLDDAAKVQEYIDGEHADTTYDPKYQGIYDDRKLDPGELSELEGIVRDNPWDEARLEKVYGKLYDGAAGKNEDYTDLRKEKATLENTPGRPSKRMKRKIDDLDRQIDKVWEWFQSLDRRVYLVHMNMGRVVNPEWADELKERYRFQMEIQRLYLDARFHQDKAFAFYKVLFSIENPHPEFVAEVMQVLRQAWRALKNILKDAREINLPAMRNFEEGERLADFILEEKLLPELPLSYVKGKWIGKLLDQLDTVKNRCFRLHWKSVGGVLALQEKIAEAWRQRKAPVEAAAVVDAVEALPVDAVEAVLAEVVEATPLAAEVVEAEVVEAVIVEELPPPLPPPAARPAVPVAVAVAVVPGPEPETDEAFVVPEPEAVFVLPDLGPPPVAPPVAAEPEPAVVPPPTLPSNPVEEIFTLGAATPAATGPVGADDIFSLDADARPTAAAFVQPAVPELDLSAAVAVEAMVEPAREPIPLIVRPARNGRPEVRITVLRPGEKSPLG